MVIKTFPMTETGKYSNQLYIISTKLVALIKVSSHPVPFKVLSLVDSFAYQMSSILSTINERFALVTSSSQPLT